MVSKNLTAYSNGNFFFFNVPEYIFLSKFLLRGIQSALSVNSEFKVVFYLSANVKDPLM